MSDTQFWDVLTKKEYVNNGATKILWHKVGVVKTTRSGRRYLQLFQYPDTDYFIIEPQDEEYESIKA